MLCRYLTTSGIASPSAEAQAVSIRTAYAAAGIEEDALHTTGYLECHGTGTLAGDPVEVAAAASVLSVGRSPANPLIIGSIKSNIGHSEPAAGVSGLIKAVLAVEKGIIPGNPTFVDPNPKSKSKSKMSNYQLCISLHHADITRVSSRLRGPKSTRFSNGHQVAKHRAAHC